MDIGAFVQENRRWLIGCAVGGLAFLIAFPVIDSIYDPTAPMRGITALASRAPREVYARGDRDALEEEQQKLVAERDRLQAMLAFERRSAFELPAGADAGSFLFQAGRKLKQNLLVAANERNIAVNEKEIAWAVPPGVEEIKRVLFGLELLDEAQRRLFAAHDAARGDDPDAVGLRSILQLRAEPQKNARQSFRGARKGAVDLADYFEQERLAFKFEADAATLTAFFEKCREPGRTLVVERVQMQQPGRVGDPVVVSGTLTGIAFKQPE
ncbi:MAG: hypothetical protein KDE27_24940 [Planctomycetes bacterium]|nr:hypothetical protein [Planctomycetota bacterium]